MSSTVKSIGKAGAESGPASPRVAVWDLPVRLFHWSLAALIAFSWWSAENDELELHLYSGYAILTLIIFRLLWGVFGSSTARFRNFIRGPRAVIAYLKDSAGWNKPGHSPLGALSVLAMLVVLKLQVATGLLNADEDGLAEGPLAARVSEATGEFVHAAHGWLWDLLLILIGLHIMAVLFYQFVRRRNLIPPMITGKAPLGPGSEPMRPGRWWAALLCFLAAIAFTRLLLALGG